MNSVFVSGIKLNLRKIFLVTIVFFRLNFPKFVICFDIEFIYFTTRATRNSFFCDFFSLILISAVIKEQSLKIWSPECSLELRFLIYELEKLGHTNFRHDSVYNYTFTFTQSPNTQRHTLWRLESNKPQCATLAGPFM